MQLPNGVEKHIESGLLKSAVGAAAGLAVGVVFFRGGKGWRMASAAAGVGVAIHCGNHELRCDQGGVG